MTKLTALSFDFAGKTLSDIAAFYNELVLDVGHSVGGKTVNRFADRKTAVSRTEKLLAERNAMALRLAAVVAKDSPPAAPKAPRTPRAGSNGAAISASWADPAVRAARIARHGVRFTDASGSREFRSTRAAFEALGFPRGVCIAFRGKLKAACSLEGFGGKWSLIR